MEALCSDLFANVCSVIFFRLVYLFSHLKTGAPWTNSPHVWQEGRRFACKEAFPGAQRHLAHKFIFNTNSIQQLFHIYALVVQDLHELGAQLCKMWLSREIITKQAILQWLILQCAPSFYLLLLISQVLKGIISASAGGKLMVWLLPQASTLSEHYSVHPGGTEGYPHVALWESIQTPTCKGHSLGNLVRYWHKNVCESQQESPQKT